MDWKPEQAGTYNIYAMAVGSVGQTGDHYTISEPFVFELSEDQLAQFAKPQRRSKYSSSFPWATY